MREVNILCIDSTCLMSSILWGCQSGEQYSARLHTSVLYSGIIILALRSLKTEKIQDDVFLAVSVMLEMCLDHERSELIVTPRSLTVD